MDGILLLDLTIEANGPSVHLKGDGSEVDMIPFKGSAGGPLLQGTIEPCGVDTQLVNAAGVRHMSARYMISGTDATGRPVRLYVENNGWFDDATKTMPFHTVPTFFSDSPDLLAKLSGPVVGEGAEEADGLHIRFYHVTSEKEGSNDA